MPLASLLAYVLCLLPTIALAQESLPAQPIVHASLVAEHTGIVAGQPLRVGILLQARDGWHTYWENPGDAGMATTLNWTLPPGFKASGIDWPVPQRLAEGPLVTYAYIGKVFLPVTITPPATLDSSKSYPLRVKASWLVCKDICIPESAELDMTLPGVPNAAPSTSAALFAEHDRARPRVLQKPGGYRVDGKHIVLNMPWKTIRWDSAQSANFFPRQENVILYAEPQSLDKATHTLTLAKSDTTPDSTISGILTLTGANSEQHNYDIVFTPHSAVMTENHASTSLSFVLLTALLGGLILNLMPCVLPVLSLKALAIAKKGGHAHAVVVRQGIAYTLGILVSFALVAGILIALRSGGQAIGWGYQMQSPAFVGFLIDLLFLVGLSLSGFFHLPVLLGSAGSELARASSVRGSFLTGVLATAVATPCTAPFMASAVGVALTLPAPQSLLVFEALGLGLALPFLLISLFPALRRFIPRPGAWMQTFQQFLAFPMYGSVIWLLWVLTLQTGPGGMVVALSALLAMVVVIWLKSLFEEGSPAYRLLALALCALILALSLPTLSRMEIDQSHAMEVMEHSGVETVAFSQAKLDELRQAGKPVFVDATAAWCITCQLNGRTVIHTAPVMDAFKKHGVTLMIADWTRRNDEITAFLSSFGYKGVPLYVVYPARGEPSVLPQLLTSDIVIHAISPKGE